MSWLAFAIWCERTPSFSFAPEIFPRSAEMRLSTWDFRS